MAGDFFFSLLRAHSLVHCLLLFMTNKTDNRTAFPFLFGILSLSVGYLIIKTLIFLFLRFKRNFILGKSPHSFPNSRVNSKLSQVGTRNLWQILCEHSGWGRI